MRGFLGWPVFCLSFLCFMSLGLLRDLVGRLPGQWHARGGQRSLVLLPPEHRGLEGRSRKGGKASLLELRTCQSASCPARSGPEAEAMLSPDPVTESDSPKCAVDPLRALRDIFFFDGPFFV